MADWLTKVNALGNTSVTTTPVAAVVRDWLVTVIVYVAVLPSDGPDGLTATDFVMSISVSVPGGGGVVGVVLTVLESLVLAGSKVELVTVAVLLILVESSVIVTSKVSVLVLPGVISPIIHSPVPGT